jgi:hypothetical protein
MIPSASEKKRATLLTAAVLIWVPQAVAHPPRPATDEEIADMIASSGQKEDYDDADMVYLLDEADVYVRASGLATTESRQVIKILTDAAVKSQAVQRLEFDPDTYRVTVRSIQIHRKDGGVEDVDVSTVATQPARQHMLYWGNEQHVLALPRLDVGDTVVTRISKTGVNIAYLQAGADGSGGSGGGGDAEAELQPPMPGHWFEVTRFQSAYPIRKKRYSVHMPQDKPVQFEVCNGQLQSSLWFSQDHHIYTFEATDIPAIEREPHMVALDDCVAKVVMATVPDWPMKSRWFHEVNEPQFEADKAIKAKVEALTAGLTDQKAKAEVLLHWVADNIRYCGTSRGPREGFTLHTGIETYRDRMGVCKDIAGMLITMLRVIGMEAYPTLTMAGSRVEYVPADQFNHTVVAVREKDGSFTLYDPTWAPHARQIWSVAEPVQGVVYGTPEGQDLTVSPYFPPQDNRLAAKSEARIEPDGTLSATINMDLRGYPCNALRRAVFRQTDRGRIAYFEQALEIAPNAKLEKLTFSDPEDYSRDSSLQMRVTADGFAAGDGAARMFRLPLMSGPLVKFLARELAYSVDKKERKYAFRLRATRLVRFEETIRLPSGWTVEHAPQGRELKSDKASLTFTAEPGVGVLTYRFELTINDHIIPPDDYAGFKEAFDAMNELKDAWVVCAVAAK